MPSRLHTRKREYQWIDWFNNEGNPIRPSGYFASCYADPDDARFEERICRGSKPVLDA